MKSIKSLDQFFVALHTKKKKDFIVSFKGLAHAKFTIHYNGKNYIVTSHVDGTESSVSKTELVNDTKFIFKIAILAGALSALE